MHRGRRMARRPRWVGDIARGRKTAAMGWWTSRAQNDAVIGRRVSRAHNDGCGQKDGGDDRRTSKAQRAVEAAAVPMLRQRFSPSRLFVCETCPKTVELGRRSGDTRAPMLQFQTCDRAKISRGAGRINAFAPDMTNKAAACRIRLGIHLRKRCKFGGFALPVSQKSRVDSPGFRMGRFGLGDRVPRLQTFGEENDRT